MIRRIVVLIVAWLATWLGVAQPAATAAAPPVVAHVFDSSLQPVLHTSDDSGRGPPATTYDRVARPAVAGVGADCPQVRVNTVMGCGHTTCDVPVSFPQVVSSTGTTLRSAMATGWDISSLQQSRVAAEGGSALAQSSSAAFRAADGASGWAPSAKHLAGAGGRWNKFSAESGPAALVEQALRSPGAVFRPDAQAGRFIVETDMGRTIGTRGESWLKIVVGDDGRIITGYPVKR